MLWATRRGTRALTPARQPTASARWDLCGWDVTNPEDENELFGKPRWTGRTEELPMRINGQRLDNYDIYQVEINEPPRRSDYSKGLRRIRRLHAEVHPEKKWVRLVPVFRDEDMEAAWKEMPFLAGDCGAGVQDETQCTINWGSLGW